MLRIVKSFLTIAIVAAIAVGATGAYFSDNLSVPGNTLSSGTLDIVYSGTASTTMNLPNMVPGTWYGTGDEYKLTVNNSGSGSTMPAKYRIRETMVSETLAGTYGLMNVKVYRKEGASWVNYYDSTLSGMVVDPILCLVMGNLPTGNSHEWKFEFQLDPSADNTFQGKTAVFDLFVDATQSTNPSW